MRKYSAILGPVDSAFYYVERPETPMNIGALTIFDGTIDFDVLTEHVEQRLHVIPRYRDRLVQAPFRLGQPTWIADPNFYIGNHVKRERIDPPGSEVELRKLAGELLSQMLDRNRPLWEIHLIEGLSGQTALFFKVHHCMVDGLEAVELFTFMMDVVKETTSHEASAPKLFFDPPTLPNAVTLTMDSLLRDRSHQFGMLRKLTRETLRLGSVVTDREKRLKMLVAAVHLINNNLQPIKKLPINGKNIGLQNMVWAEFPLDKIHAIRKQCEASVNDVMLSLLTKAVEHYTDAKGGTDQRFLRILVPVNMRDEAEKGDYGNRISILPIDVPFNIADPLEHLKAVTRYSKVMKESSLAYSVDLILTLPSLLPSLTHAPIWGIAPVAFSLLAHTWCTNVAAMPIPMYLLGHEMQHVYGYFPLNPSMGLACVVVSYNGKITMSLITDEGIVNDADSLERFLKEAYNDLVSTLPVKPPVPPASLKHDGIPANAAVKQNGSSPQPAKAEPPASAPATVIYPPAAPVAITVPDCEHAEAVVSEAVMTEILIQGANNAVTQAGASAEVVNVALSESAPVSMLESLGQNTSILLTDLHSAQTGVTESPSADVNPPVPQGETAAEEVDVPAAASAAAAVDDPEKLPVPVLEAQSIPLASVVSEVQSVPAHAVVAQNGSSTAATMVAAPASAPALVVDPPEAPSATIDRPVCKLFSAEWAKLMHEEVNHSQSYRSASLNWTAGSLAFVLERTPEHGFDVPAAVWLDLYRGVCRAARALPVQQAMREATFVIQGDYDAWMEVLSGRGAPLLMLTNGRLKLRKGALLRLLPHTRSAGELVHCAQRVPWEE